MMASASADDERRFMQNLEDSNADQSIQNTPETPENDSNSSSMLTSRLLIGHDTPEMSRASPYAKDESPLVGTKFRLGRSGFNMFSPIQPSALRESYEPSTDDAESSFRIDGDNEEQQDQELFDLAQDVSSIAPDPVVGDLDWDASRAESPQTLSWQQGMMDPRHSSMLSKSVTKLAGADPATLMRELALERSKSQSLKEELEQVRREKEEVQTTLNDVKDMMFSVEQEARINEVLIGEISSEKEALIEKVAELRTAVAEEKKKRDAVEQQHEDAQQEIGALNERLSSAMTALAQRDDVIKAMSSKPSPTDLLSPNDNDLSFVSADSRSMIGGSPDRLRHDVLMSSLQSFAANQSAVLDDKIAKFQYLASKAGAHDGLGASILDPALFIEQPETLRAVSNLSLDRSRQLLHQLESIQQTLQSRPSATIRERPLFGPPEPNDASEPLASMSNEGLLDTVSQVIANLHDHLLHAAQIDTLYSHVIADRDTAIAQLKSQMEAGKADAAKSAGNQWHAEKKKLEDQIASLQVELKNARDDQSHLKAYRDTLLDTQSRVQSNFDHQNQETREMVMKLTEEKVQLEDELQQVCEERDKAVNEVREYKVHLASLETEMDVARSAKEKAEHTCKAVENQLAMSEAQNEKLKNRIDRAAIVVADRENTIQQLDKKLDDILADRKKLLGAHESDAGHVRLLNEQLGLAKDANETLRRQHSQTVAELEDARFTLSTTQSSVRRMESEIRDRNDNVSELTLKLDTAKDDLRRAEGTIASLEQRIRETEQAISTTTASEETFKRRLSDIENIKKRVEAEKDALQVELTTFKTQTAQQIEELNTAIQSLRSEREVLVSEVAEKTASLSKEQQESSKLRDVLAKTTDEKETVLREYENDLKQRCEEAVETVVTVREQKEEFAKQVVGLQQDLDNANQDLDTRLSRADNKLRDALIELEGKRSLLDASKDKQEHLLAQLDSERAALNAKIAELKELHGSEKFIWEQKGELDAARTSLADSIDTASKLQSELEVALGECVEAEKAIEIAHADMTLMQQDLSERAAQIETLEKDLDATRTSFAKSIDKASALERELKSAKDQLEAAEKERDAAQGMISTLSNNSTTHSEKISDLISKNERLQDELKFSQIDASSLRDKTEQLQVDVRELSDRKSTLEMELNAKVLTLDDAAAENELTVNKLAQAESQLKDAVEKLAAEKAAVATKEHQANVLRHDLSELRRKLMHIETEKTLSSSSQHSVQSELIASRKTISDLKAQTESVHAAREAVEEELVKVTGKLMAAKQDAVLKSERAETFAAEIKILQKQCENAEEKLSAAKARETTTMDELRNVRLDANTLQIRLESVTEKKERAEQNLANAQMKADEHESELASMRSRLVNSQTAIAKLNREIESLRDRLEDANRRMDSHHSNETHNAASLRADLARLQDEMCTARLENDELTKYSNGLQKIIDGYEDESSLKHSDLEAKRTEVNTLRQRLLDCDAMLDEAHSRISHLETELTSVKNQRSVAEQHSRYWKTQCGEMKSGVATKDQNAAATKTVRRFCRMFEVQLESFQDQAAGQLQQHGDKLSQCESAVARLSSVVVSMQDEFESSDVRFRRVRQDYQRRLDGVEKRYNDKQKEATELSKNVLSLEIKLKSRCQEVKGLEELLDAKSNEYDALQAKLQDNSTIHNDERVAELRKEVERVQKEKQSLQSSLRKAQDVMKMVETQLQSLKAANAGLEREKAALQDTAASLKNEIATLMERLSAMQTTLHRYEHALDRKATNGTVDSEQRVMEFESVQKRLDVVEEEKARLAQELDEVKSTQQLKMAEVYLVNAQMQEMKRAMEETASENAGLTATIKDLEQRSDLAAQTLKVELAESLKQHANYEALIKTHQGSIEELRQALEMAQGESRELVLTLTQLESERDRLRKQLDESQSRIASLQRQMESLHDTIAEMEVRTITDTKVQAERDNLKKQLDESQSRIASLKSQTESLQRKIYELEARSTNEMQLAKRVSALQNENENLNASMAKFNASLEVHKREQEDAETSFEQFKHNNRVGGLTDAEANEVLNCGGVRAVTDAQLRDMIFNGASLSDIVRHYESKIMQLHGMLEQGEMAIKLAESRMNQKREKHRSHKVKTLAERIDKENIFA